jgi:hypothetical protein
MEQGRTTARLGRAATGVVCLAWALVAAPVRADEPVEGTQGTRFGFERLDLIDDGGGGWVNYDLPMVAARPEVTAWKWARQLQLVLRTPVPGFNVGFGVGSVSFQYDVRVTRAVSAFAGLNTAWLMPRSLTLGWALHLGPIRVALGVVFASTSRWSDIHWTVWSVLPVIGLGIGREEPSLARF